MKTEFTPAQIDTGKKLVKWFLEHKVPHDTARIEIAQLLTRYPHSKIKSAMTHSGCTSPLLLKKILEGKESFKCDKLKLY